MFERWLLASILCACACSEGKSDSTSGAPADEQKQGSEQSSATEANQAEGASGLAAALSEADRRLVVEADKTTWDVKLSEKTTLVSGDAVAALVTADDDEHRYTFDKNKAAKRGLKLEAGRVLLISGRALRKIRNVEEKGDKLVVSTDYASLNEAIRDGEIGASATLPLDKKHVVAMVLPDGRELPVRREGRWLVASLASAASPVVAAAGIDWAVSDGSLEYKAKLEPRGDRIDVAFQIQRKMQPAGNLVYKAKGTIKPIKVDARATFKDGKTETFDYGQDDVGGEFELSVAAAGGGKVEIDKEIPALKLKWVVMIGAVPLVITTKAKLIGRISLPPKGSSTFSSKFQFSGKGGISLVGRSIDAKIDFGQESFSPKSLDAAAMIGQPVDVQFGVAFPMVSAGFFDSFMVPNFFTGATVGARLLWGPICKSGYVKFTAHYGYDFKVLGVDLASKKVKFYEKQRTADQNGCTEKHK